MAISIMVAVRATVSRRPSHLKQPFLALLLSVIHIDKIMNRNAFLKKTLFLAMILPS
jgi:hypothetical protein